MAFNAQGAFNSALSLFCSLYQDMNPADLPEGLSPDNQDVWFFPGSVQTRPALARLLASIGTQQIMSMKEFLLPNGDVLNVFLDSQGNLRTRDAISGGLAPLTTVTPGVQFKAENAFDKQWYAFYGQSSAFSQNPFVGLDVPRYYDGQNVWRVTQDAPGQAPQAADENLSWNIVASPGGATPYAPANISGISQAGNLVTVQTTLGAGGFIRIGDQFQIAGFSGAGAGYNGTWTCSGFQAGTGFLQFVATQTGLPVVGSGVGTIQPALMIITTTANTTLAIGQLAKVAGVGTAGYNITGQVVQIAGPITYVYNAGVFGLANDGSGTITTAGNIVAGLHNGVLMFKSQNGALTAPSIPFQWNASGGKRVILSQIAIGPAGTAQRVIAFTESAGSAYSYLDPSIIPSVNGLPAVTITGTIIFDNVSTSAILDFTDVELADGTFIDEDGNNLFNQIVLAPCLGVFNYGAALRLCWIGEINNLKNFLNMGFDGGYIGALASTPLGWTAFGGGTGVLVNNPQSASLGFAYQMTSAGGATDAGISQAAYQDYYGAPILLPNKIYIFRCQAKQLNAAAGNLIAEFYSPSLGSLAKATILASGISPTGGWVNATFSAATPAAIPADAILRIYLANVTNGAVLTTDEVEIIDSSQPVLAQQMRVSYINNPFGYDVESGLVGINSSDSLTGAFEQRGFLYLNTDAGLWQTQNNGTTEPAGSGTGAAWPVIEYAKACGCAGPNAVDVGEGTGFWAGKHGHRLFAGSEPKKISQEFETTWDTINWNATLALWLVNDPVQRMVYIGLPVNGANAPNLVYPMSYRSVNVAYEVPDPLHISFSGKMICSDLARKSSRWNMFANCGALMTTNTALPRQMCIGSGNGQAAGVGSAFGDIYTLSFLKFTDDDYGVISSYYVTYAHWNHDIESQIPALGLHRKIYTYLSAFITGVGNVQITPLVDRLNNPWNPTQQYQLSQNQNHDLEWRLNVLGDRVFFKVAVTPFPGTTDAAFNLQHMVVAGRMDKIFPVRGAYL